MGHVGERGTSHLGFLWGFSLVSATLPVASQISVVSDRALGFPVLLFNNKDSAFGNHGHFFPLHQMSELKMAPA